MSPKPIVRKAGIPEGAPPLSELRSPLAMGLAEMQARHDKMISELSPNATACMTSIRDLNRYESLTDEEGGMIRTAKDELAVNVERLRMAVKVATMSDEALVLKPQADGQPAQSTQPSPPLGAIMRDMTHIARNVIKHYDDLVKFSAEAAELEPKILDDSTLPDFAQMNADAKREELETIQAGVSGLVSGGSASVELGEIQKVAADLLETMGDELKPISWDVSFTFQDSVVAPSEANARDIVAMRLRNKMDSIKDRIIVRQRA